MVSVDIGEWPDRPAHPRLTYLTASSTDPEVVAQWPSGPRRLDAAAVLDSGHRRGHVLAELRAYAPMVTPGSYLVVEDTNVNGHPVYEAFGPGPMEAVQDFLKERDDLRCRPLAGEVPVHLQPGRLGCASDDPLLRA